MNQTEKSKNVPARNLASGLLCGRTGCAARTAKASYAEDFPQTGDLLPGLRLVGPSQPPIPEIGLQLAIRVDVVEVIVVFCLLAEHHLILLVLDTGLAQSFGKELRIVVRRGKGYEEMV